MLGVTGIEALLLALGGGALVALGVYTWWRSRLGPVPPGSECLRARPADVAVGGAVRLGRFGDESEDVELTIASQSFIRMGGEERLELSGPYRGRTLAVEWGERHVIAYKRTQVPLSELKLESAQLQQAQAGTTLVVRDASFVVEEAGDATRRGPGAPGGRPVRVWGLLDEGKRLFVRIERAGDQPALASEGILVASDAIEIVRLGPPGAAVGPA